MENIIFMSYYFSMDTQFSKTLKLLRVNRGLRQRQLAELIGCEQSYLSALERAHKHPPQKNKLEFIIKKMDLSEEEASQLREAAANTIRHIKIPQSAGEDIREMCKLFEQTLPEISNVQVKLITLALSLPRNQVEAPKM